MKPLQYVESSLLKNEKLMYGTRLHWIIFAPAVSLLVIGLLLWVTGYLNSFLVLPFGYGQQLGSIIVLIMIVGGLFSLIKAFIAYHTSEYAITNRRVMVKVGWIRRDALEIYLTKLEAVNVNQSVLGRLLDYGTIIIIGTGGTQDYYGHIPDPMRFRRLVQREVEKLSQRS